MGSFSSALVPDTEEFESIVSFAERLNERVARGADDSLHSELQTLATLMMEEERKGNQNEETNSPTHQENSLQTSENESPLPAAASKNLSTASFSSLLPKALNAVLHSKLPAGPTSEPEPSSEPLKHTPANLQQLETELRGLREQFDQMKSQHNKEIKLLMNELDEEKRIRLTLQMEIQRMKKRMSK